MKTAFYDINAGEGVVILYHVNILGSRRKGRKRFCSFIDTSQETTGDLGGEEGGWTQEKQIPTRNMLQCASKGSF